MLSRVLLIGILIGLTLVVPVQSAMVTLPVPLHRPHVGHGLLADAENLTYKSITMTVIATDKWGFVFTSMPRLAGVASYVLDQITIQFNGATTAPTSGLSVSVQGIGASGLQGDGVVNGNTVNVPAGSILPNALVTVPGLGATISSPAGVYVDIRPANTGDAGVNIVMTAYQAATGRVAFLSTARVVKNNAALTDSMPMTFLATAAGVPIPVLGNYPHRISGLLNATGVVMDRTDPFIVNVTATCTSASFCFTPGATAAVDAAGLLTSTAHGFTGVSPYMRVQLFDGPYAGLTRVAVHKVDNDNALLDEPFPAVIAAGTVWRRWLFATEYGMHCSGVDTKFKQTIDGIWASLAASGTSSAFNIYLLGADGQAPLAKNEGKLLGGMLSGLGTTGTPGQFNFDTPYTLATNVAHYYTVAGAGTQTIGIPVGKTVTAAQLPGLYDGMGGCVFTERLKQKGSGTITVSNASGTTARITFSAALTLLNRVILNTTTAAYNDWIQPDAGSNFRCRLKTEIVAQTVYDVDQCLGTMTLDATPRAFTVYGAWSDRAASIASMALSISEVDDGTGTGTGSGPHIFRRRFP